MSPEVVKHMNALRQQLQGLGDVILSNIEREETKIVAGIIIRQALEHHIDFTSFWTSEKVRNSVPSFPKDSSSQWMSKFQDFLDTLGDLALANPITDPLLVYPVSLVASNGFQWAASDNGVPIAISQIEVLTIILPDVLQRDVHFLDIPVAHIQSTRTRQRAPLHDSQSRTTKHEPCELILTLENSSWTYRLDSSECVATKFTILFEHLEDAKECEMSIRELQQSNREAVTCPGIHSAVPSGSLHDIHSPPTPTPPPQTGEVARQSQEQQARLNVRENIKSDANHNTQHLVSCISPIDISQRRLTARSHVETKQLSPDQLGISPDTKVPSLQRTTDKALVVESHEPAEQALDYQLAKNQQSTEQVEYQGGIDAGRAAEHVQPTRKHERTTPVQEPKQVQAVEAQKRTRKMQDETHVISAKTTRVGPQTRSMHASSSPDDLSNTMTSPTEMTNPIHATSKRAMYGKGKLPKVSQTTKQVASQRPHRQPDIFAIPREDHRKAIAKEQTTPKTFVDAKPISHTKVRTARVAPRVRHNAKQGKKTRSKRRADTDDDFTPNKVKPAKKVGAKRKSVCDVAVSNKPSKKKAETVHKATAQGDSTEKASSASNARVQQIIIDQPKNELRSQRSRIKESDRPVSSAVARTTLIGGLLGSQRRSPTAKATFKKPALPSRVPHPPLTPTQRRPRPTKSSMALLTPTALPRSNTSVSHMSSSPPLCNMAEEYYVGPQSGAIEAEILSSNSKPVPASPHAESTAISGHADCDDMEFEKRKSDIQTAKLDPFKQRREGRKVTSFIRRLTGDSLVDSQPDAIEGLSCANPFDPDASFNSDTEDLPVRNTSRPLPLPKLEHGKPSSLTTNRAPFSQPLAWIPGVQQTAEGVKEAHAETTKMLDQQDDLHFVHTSQSSKRKAVADVEGSHDLPRKKVDMAVGQRISHKYFSVMSRNAAPILEEENTDTDIVDFILPAPQQTVDDSQPENATKTQGEFNMDGDTLVNNDTEEQLQTPRPASVHFRSSPPLPCTPSSHSSTSAEEEPTPPPTLPTSEAEEMEWEANMQPHQRALHDMLMRVSKRVLRHVVDNETAVTDIADVFENDGAHLVKDVLQQHNSACDELWEDMHEKKETLQKEMENSVQALLKDRERVSALV